MTIRLNLPEYSFRFQKSEKGIQIFDSLRKKFVALTPEEWVRQNFIQYILHEKKYPASLISVETGLKYNRLKKRTDIIVHDRTGKPWMLIECKSPEVKISQDVFDQVATYNIGKGQKAKYLCITNGIKHFCCEMNYEKNNYDFVKELPIFT